MTRAEVQALLVRHAAGDVEAGNRVFALADQYALALVQCSFNELLDAAGYGYRPTLRGSVESAVLADCYDYAQARRGVEAKAHRGPEGT